MSARDEFRDRRFLAEAAAGHLAFVEQALARLEAGEAVYGSSWSWIGVRAHLAELLEEAADLGSWAALADQAIDVEHGLSVEAREQIRQALRRAAALGAAVHRVLSEAAETLEERSRRLPCLAESERSQ